MEPLLQTLVRTTKGISDNLESLKELQNIISRLSVMEGYLERIAASSEKVAATNEQLAALMEKAWSGYDAMKSSEIKTTTTTKRVR